MVQFLFMTGWRVPDVRKDCGGEGVRSPAAWRPGGRPSSGIETDARAEDQQLGMAVARLPAP
jgi:hypothetical protein